MSKLYSIIGTIKELKNIPNYQSALTISKLLENNALLFSNKLNTKDFDFLLKNFQDLSYSNPKDHASYGFIRDYEKYTESLLFHLNKIC